MLKILLLLSLLVTPRVFLEGGRNTPPQPLEEDLLVGHIKVYAQAKDDFETFRVVTESFYSLNISNEDVVCITFDAYKEIIVNECLKYYQVDTINKPDQQNKRHVQKL